MHSPEPGRDISLGSSQIPHICVLWETHTGLTVAPARGPVPGPPAPGPPPPATCVRPGPLFRRPGGLGPPYRATRKKGKRRYKVRGQPPGAPEPQRPESERGLRPARPSPAQGDPSGGGGPPAAPTPHPRPLTEPLPSEWSSLNIHFMAAAGKGCSRLSEPRSSAHQPQQQRRQRQQQRRLHDRRDFRLPEPSNRLGAGLPALLARTASLRAGPHSRRRGRRWLREGLPGEVG